MTSSWMLARLKDATRLHHRDADADRLAPLARRTTVGAYVSYLARIFGFEATVEEALAGVPELALLVDPAAWQRSAWLVEDLETLGLVPDEIDALPRCPHATIGLFATTADALAWMYVVERNAALNGVVRRHLARRMPGQIAAASAYLTRSEEQSPYRWRALGAALDAVATSSWAADRVVVAADTAFRLQQRWLRHLKMPELESGTRLDR